MAVELNNLFHSIARWRDGEIDDSSYAALYFLHWQTASHGKRFASRRNKGDPRPDPHSWFVETSALDKRQVRDYLLWVFERYQFFGIICNVPVALAAWLKMEWPLTLCEHIPNSHEVLGMQVKGTRPVTVLSDWPRMLDPVLTKPNAFAFMIHDLEHSWKFFHNPGMHRQQREFFRLLLAAFGSGLFESYLQDPVFSAKFDYLISDMNTHTMHAAQFLRAILVEFHLRRENMRHPDDLTRGARHEVADVMASLLGADWLAEVERRMIQPSIFSARP
jgi:hypothetical protein